MNDCLSSAFEFRAMCVREGRCDRQVHTRHLHFKSQVLLQGHEHTPLLMVRAEKMQMHAGMKKAERYRPAGG